MDSQKFLHDLSDSTDKLFLGNVPPSIIPVIILRGNDAEMGYQYGQQMGFYINLKKKDVWASAISQFGNPDRVNKVLQAVQYYLRKYTPEAIDQMKAVSRGATSAGFPVTYTDVLLINSDIGKPYPSAVFPDEAANKNLTGDDCSVWSVWGSTARDRSLICGDSIDFPFDYHLIVIAFPDNGHNYMSATRAGRLAGAPCMNDRGVFIGSAGGGAERDIDFDYGLPYTSGIYQHLLRFSNTATAAKENLLPWPIMRSWNFLVSDTGGRAYVVEQTAALKCVRQPGDFGERDFIYATNNYFCDEMRTAIKDEKFIAHAGWLGSDASISSIPRNLEMWHLFSQYSGRVDLDFAKMMWRLPGKPPPHPMDSKAYEDTQGKGWDQKICNLENSRVGILQPRDGDSGVAHFCAGPAGRIAYPLKPCGGDYYQIAGTHSFYQVALADNPKAVVEAAKNEAHRTIADAYRNLMTLNYTDPGYAILNGWYTKANKEYYQGLNALNEGWLAEGDHGLYLQSQATTYFARSQAHAKQVVHAMVPPPTCPEDLGLKPMAVPEP